MYKIFFILTFILFSTHILPAQEYFRSNSIGMALEKISSIRSDESEFILETVVSGSIKTRMLYKNGDIYKKWIIEYDSSGDIKRESFFENKNKTVTIFRNSFPVEDSFFTEGRLTEKNKYIYFSNGKLKYVENYNREGNLLSRRSYDNLKTGKVSGINLNEENGKADSVSNYSFKGTDLKSEWQGNSSGTGHFFFYESGKTQYSEKWTDNSLISRTEYFYSNGSDLIETIENYLLEKKEIIKKYDERMRVIRESEKIDNLIIKTIVNTYSNDNVIKKIIKTGEDTEKYIYEYSDDEILKELYYLNGSLKKKTVYEEGIGNYYEDLYSENIKYMRIYYRDNEKYKTEQ